MVQASATSMDHYFKTWSESQSLFTLSFPVRDIVQSKRPSKKLYVNLSEKGTFVFVIVAQIFEIFQRTFTRIAFVAQLKLV